MPAMATDGKEIEDVRIREVVYPGRGVGNLQDGRVVFVPNVLPGETVSVEVLRRRPSYAEGRLHAVRVPATERIPVACPLAESGACPGCAYQHADYGAEVALKHGQLHDLLTRLGGVDTDIRQAPVPSPLPLYYRNKIELHVGGGTDGLSLGYVGHDNETIVDVPACLLAAAPIGALLQRLRADDEFVRALRPGQTITFRHTPHDGPVFWLQGERLGPSWLRESSPMGDMIVPARSFYQVNPALAHILVTDIREAVRRLAPAFVVDAYCGVGVFALAALEGGAKEVFGIDSDARAIRAARRNARARGYHTRAGFVAHDAFDGLRAIPARVRPEETLIILDPTRGGVDRDVLRLLATVRPRDILYVSCAADTLARDIRTLRESDYTAASAKLYDMFPRTPHFETVVHLAAG